MRVIEGTVKMSLNDYEQLKRTAEKYENIIKDIAKCIRFIPTEDCFIRKIECDDEKLSEIISESIRLSGVYLDNREGEELRRVKQIVIDKFIIKTQAPWERD